MQRKMSSARQDSDTDRNSRERYGKKFDGAKFEGSVLEQTNAEIYMRPQHFAF